MRSQVLKEVLCRQGDNDVASVVSSQNYAELRVVQHLWQVDLMYRPYTQLEHHLKDTQARKEEAQRRHSSLLSLLQPHLACESPWSEAVPTRDSALPLELGGNHAVNGPGSGSSN